MTALQLRRELAAVEAQIEEYALTGDDDTELQAIRGELVNELAFTEHAERYAADVPIELFECGDPLDDMEAIMDDYETFDAARRWMDGTLAA